MQFNFIPETQVCRISGLTKLFPQHCQLPNLTPHQHFRALTDKLAKSTAITSTTQKDQRLLKLPQANIKKILNPAIALEEQRARDKDIGMQQQKVIDNTPIIIVPLMPRITNAPPILQAWNPTAKRTLKDTPHLHQRVTRINTPGAVPKIIRPPTHAPTLRVSPRKRTEVIPTPAAPVAAPHRRWLRTFTQQAKIL